MFARLLILFLAAITAIAAADNRTPEQRYESAVLDWRVDRVAKLKSETGYLNLVGLYWLQPGIYSFGAAADNDLVFPATETPRIGRFVVAGEGIRVEVEPGVAVLEGNSAVQSRLLDDDTTDNPVTLTHGSLAFGAVKRMDRYAIRLRDYESEALGAFPELEYFPIDPSKVVFARLRYYDEPRVASVNTVIEGLGWAPKSPGVVEFRLDGKDYKLEAYESGDQLFFVFGDRTNGRETYPAGRFLYAPWPDETGRTVLDFNRSYSPPCAFNDFSTCPVASPRNRLPVRVEAGELYNPEAYAGSSLP